MTRQLGELNSIAPPQAHHRVTSDLLAQKILAWRKHQTVGHATDLVGSGLTLGRAGEVVEAARFLLRDNRNVSRWGREFAEQALKPPRATEIVPSPNLVERGALYKQVRNFRQLLRIEPKDPVTWVELSRTYACLGLGKKAERSMTIALQLATNNRFVLRSASRLWIYLRDPQRAHHIIVKSDRTRHDPWLVAAEIAVGSSIPDKTPALVKVARRMLSEGQFSPAHTSELASAVATLELGSGHDRKAKRLFGRSLDDPTENSIAQATWAWRRHGIQFDGQYPTVSNTFESEFWTCYQESQWENAIERCKLWQYDQPFSSRPSIAGSYISGVALEDYAASARFAEQGLVANPTDFTLWNNLAYARINLGNMEGANEALSRASRSPVSEQHRAVLQATKGLLEFRTGNVARGRQLYSDARSKAEKMRNGDKRLPTLISVFHAIEEASLEVPDTRLMVSKARRALEQIPDPVCRVLEHRLARMTPDLPGGP